MNTVADDNDHDLNFIWLSSVITVAENQNFQDVAVELWFSNLFFFFFQKDNIFHH